MSFIKCIKTHSLATFPFPIDNLAPETEVEALGMDLEENNEVATSTARIGSIPSKNIILGAFTRPAVSYFARIAEIKIDISLKKLHTTNSLEEATEAATIRLDTEVSVDNDLLEEIIQKKVAARTKNLLSEVGQMKKQLAALTKGQGTKTPIPKKDRRGHPTKTPGASILKKKSPRSNAADQQAAAAVKGTVRKQTRKKKKPDAKKKRQPKKK